MMRALKPSSHNAAKGASSDRWLRDQRSDPPVCAPVILYGDDLAAPRQGIEAAGGRISKPEFAFPGGRRFQLLEPDGLRTSLAELLGLAGAVGEVGRHHLLGSGADAQGSAPAASAARAGAETEHRRTRTFDIG
jgi:hypothetical protein